MPKSLTNKREPVAPAALLLLLNRICFLVSAMSLLFMIFAILTGFPPVLAGKIIKLKNLKPPFLIFLLSFLGTFFLRPDGLREGRRLLEEKLEAIARSKKSLWVIFGAASLLFTWQQITEYLAIEINFLPFSFYDYMFYYYFQGKIHFTGLLHTHYHINNILFLMAPLWKIFQSPLLLVLSYGAIASLAIFPLYSLARERFQDHLAALFTAFLYLNYRYLQNVLQMNFSPEIFYSLFLFWAVASALKGKWGFYYLALAFGLSVKEDSFIYFSAVGFLLLFLKCKAGEKQSRAWHHGLATVALSLGYYFFITRIFMPWTGSLLLKENFNNFEGKGETELEIVKHLVLQPQQLAAVFFGNAEKLKTFWNLSYRLAFIPFFSPSVFLVLAPIFPLFMHETGRDADFVGLRFHYAAAVVPFVFISFVFGFSNLLSRFKNSGTRKSVLLGLILVLLMLNGGNYRTEKITPETLKSIRWARNIPRGKNLVTHGHLLPYVGYLKYNYYFAVPFELEEHPYRKPFLNADYYYIDKKVNPYPMDEAYLDKKIQDLGQNPDYELILQDASKRYLFRRKTSNV